MWVTWGMCVSRDMEGNRDYLGALSGCGGTWVCVGGALGILAVVHVGTCLPSGSAQETVECWISTGPYMLDV